MLLILAPRHGVAVMMLIVMIIAGSCRGGNRALNPLRITSGTHDVISSRAIRIAGALRWDRRVRGVVVKDVLAVRAREVVALYADAALFEVACRQLRLGVLVEGLGETADQEEGGDGCDR